MDGKLKKNYFAINYCQQEKRKNQLVEGKYVSTIQFLMGLKFMWLDGGNLDCWIESKRIGISG